MVAIALRGAVRSRKSFECLEALLWADISAGLDSIKGIDDPTDNFEAIQAGVRHLNVVNFRAVVVGDSLPERVGADEGENTENGEKNTGAETRESHDKTLSLQLFRLRCAWRKHQTVFFNFLGT